MTANYSSQPRTLAIYDGRCVLCRQSKRMVTGLDWLRQVEFLDTHDREMVARRVPGLDFEASMGQIHVLTPDGRLWGGFPAMRHLLRELPLGVPLWALLHLPGMNWLGPRLYAWVARRRYQINRLFGVDLCADGTCKLPG